MKRQVRDYFYFSKSEQKGIIGIVFLIIILFGVQYYLTNSFETDPIEQADLTSLRAKIDSLEKATLAKKEANKFKAKKAKLDFQVKDFNPNKLTAEEWMNFGLSEKQAQTLINYKDKIGGFESKAEVKKVFVISDELFQKLEPHILLPDENPKREKSFPKWEKKEYVKKIRVYPKVDINTSDTAQFKKLYGIGEVLAERIVKRREELGGFISKEQLKEVFGLKPETLKKLDTQLIYTPTRIRKISINNATKEELKAHPYIFWKYANVIVNYRKQHGAYRSIQDLKKIVLFNDSIFNKVQPYIEL